jgi:hypothetical protein
LSKYEDLIRVFFPAKVPLAGMNLQEENLNIDLIIFGQAHDCNQGKELTNLPPDG